MSSQTGNEVITTHIVQNLKKRQRDNKIWSVNRLQRENYFSSKFMQKMKQTSSD